MKLTYACNCIYLSDAANVSIYADFYLKYVADFTEGSYLHLAVVIAEENGCVKSVLSALVKLLIDFLYCLSTEKTLIAFLIIFLLLRKNLVSVFENEGTDSMF